MMKNTVLLCFCLAIFFISGCTTASNRSHTPKIISEQEFKNKYPDVIELKQRMNNATSHSYSPVHGTQIEYNAADGRSFLWYPGNKIILPSEWKIQSGSKSITVHVQTANGVDIRKVITPDICYRYGGSTINRVTNQRGGKWECQNYRIHQLFNVELRKGDVFKLSKKSLPPFTLKRNKTTIGQLLSQCKNCRG